MVVPCAALFVSLVRFPLQRLRLVARMSRVRSDEASVWHSSGTYADRPNPPLTSPLELLVFRPWRHLPARSGRKRKRRALSLPLCGSDRARGLPRPCVGRATAEWEGGPPKPSPWPACREAGQRGTCNPRAPAPCGSKGRSRLPPAFAVFGLGRIAPSGGRFAHLPSPQTATGLPAGYLPKPWACP